MVLLAPMVAQVLTEFQVQVARKAPQEQRDQRVVEQLERKVLQEQQVRVVKLEL